MAPLTHFLEQTTLAFKVLIVDDDLLQRKLAQAILEGPRYEVFEASNGQEGLDLIQREEFDAVVLDRQMPGMDGEEVCRRVRQDLGNHLLPLIMVTGAGSSALASALRAGATDFIHKPYNAQEFQARVDSAISRKRLTDQLESAESVLFALARMVEAKDGNTGDHCTRLAQYSVRFGEALGLGGDELLALRRGGVLHDIGKLGIPEHILLKPGGFMLFDDYLFEDEPDVLDRGKIAIDAFCTSFTRQLDFYLINYQLAVRKKKI
jgi:putative two-component system response regulator